MVVTVAVIFLMTGDALAFRNGRCGLQDNGFYSSVNGLTDLTTDQRQTIGQIHTDFQTEILPLRQALMMKQNELSVLLRQNTIDTNKTMAAQKEISTITEKIQKRSLDYRIDVLRELSSSQVSQVSTGIGLSPGGQCLGKTAMPCLCSGCKNGTSCGLGRSRGNGQCLNVQPDPVRIK